MPRLMRSTRLLPGLGALVLTAACTGNPSAVPPTPTASASAAPSQAPSSAPSATPSEAATPSASPSASAVPAGLKLSGLVLDDLRVFVSGATVSARLDDKVVASATTAADGAYALSLPAGTYRVTATKDGFTTRTQPIDLAAASTLHFGQETSSSTNPFALSDFPEIERVDVDEAGVGGPLTLKVRFSEKLGTKAQQGFDENLELRAGRTTEFLRTAGVSALRIKPERSWEDDGQTYVFKYAGPYLPSGAASTEYSIAIRQEEDLDEKDPVTRENLWDDLGIEDDKGNALGRGRMQYAFLKTPIFPYDLRYLVDPQFGYLVEDRRWRLTHEGFFTFTAKRDDVGPSLAKVALKVRDQVGSFESDVLTLTFTEPMRVAKNRVNLEFTRLDVNKEMLFLSLSTKADGSNPTAASTSIKARKIEFNRDDARIVYFHYPADTFNDQKWVEVTLGKDMLDPAGNKPDPKTLRLAGPVSGG